MLQRIQSVWLFIAALAAVATLKLPFYTGNTTDKLFAELNGTSSFVILILTVAVALLSVVAIFLFKNRKLQMQTTFVAFLIDLIVLVLYATNIKNYTEGAFALSSVISFVIPVLLILAWLGIRKDEKLVRSMDRLR